MAAPSSACTSPPARRSGITPACACRSAGCWCATRAAKRNRKPSCAPTWTPTRWTSCAGSSAGGASRPLSKKRAGTSAWKPSGNGRTWPSCVPHPRCSACSHSSRYGQRSSKPRSASYPSVSGGIQNTRQPSAMPWPSSAVNSGPRRFSQAHRITQTRQNSQPTCSTAFCSSPVGRPNLQSQAKSPFLKLWGGQSPAIGMGEAVEHEADCGQGDHCLGYFGQRLVVLGQAAPSAEPAERPFDPPAARLADKAGGACKAAEDDQHPPPPGAGQPGPQPVG